MCGITGFWNFNHTLSEKEAQKIAREMGEKLASRGPDDAGVWTQVSAGIALSHRRLSILDLSACGHQPMLSASGRYVISYNGEVYNFLDLKKDLEAQGAVFKGRSDTEVILAAIEMYGLEKAVKSFVGMFAFALWDQQDRCLHLVRDRVGVKPLYWGLQNDILFFGSQLKSFRAHPQFDPELDTHALELFFKYSYIPAPHTIFQKFYKLQPGHILTFRGRGQKNLTPYWSIENSFARREKKAVSYETLQLDLQEQLKDAVQKRMIADVPVGCFLSGGVDSSLVTALMQENSSGQVKTFSIGFEERAYDEAIYAKNIAQHLGTDHHEWYVSAKDCQDVVPDLATWYDEPFADSSQVPTYLVSKMAREHVTVSLSGDGGDELFAGYNRYIIAHKLFQKVQSLPLGLRKLVAQGLQKSPSFFWELVNKTVFCRNPYADIETKIDRLCQFLGSSIESEFYEKMVSHWGDEPLLKAPSTQSDATLDPYFGRTDLTFTEKMQWADMMTYLPDDILVKVDRASMAVSLEAREPLLDHRLIEFAWQKVPACYKLSARGGKQILKDILENYVPATYFDRPKQGFGIPLGTWLRGGLKDWASDLLDRHRLQQQGILNTDLVQKVWAQHCSGQKNFQYKLWNILMFQGWLQSFKKL